ncbi:hypothetical protein [Phyllobacterium bourgognense]|uniref:Dehydrogenase n=1 Tax=Phyllobacterium bourgognense TaxID=314236 RepID=A0A368YIV9_9HYPH|nr:hypothetical protein [Phyllobacterium bourgognense]RCW80170.1 hypothetical protein C7476_115135 [Phyllobacterium bourgognense]
MSEPALEDDDDEVDQLLTKHNGDAHAAIRTLLSEREFLMKKLHYACIAMGHGFARGWKPKTLTSRE